MRSEDGVMRGVIYLSRRLRRQVFAWSMMRGGARTTDYTDGTDKAATIKHVIRAHPRNPWSKTPLTA